MGKVKNVLFIMCDQLRADHLSCAGHPHLETPHIDALAARGVRFPRAYVQSGVCGPSRMSYYTGRYMFSHGATWNRVPLSLREKTLGEFLTPAGIKVALAGKTHMMPDLEGLERFGIEGGSALDALLRAGRFEEIDRYDGHHPPGKESGYPDYLRAQGYNSDDPWTDYVIAADGPDGTALSGWHMRNVHLPARVKEEHSETAYMTREAMRFMDEMGEKPWCLHLSYVKPHWPYMAPAPYHSMYGAADTLPLNRDEQERVDEHPVLAAYREHEEAISFSRPEAPGIVRPAYMGLIKQLDDWLGRLFAHMKASGRLDDTLIFFTSDHGDFLGDHWLGEKEMFYEEALRVPFIVVDPDPEADLTRGTVDQRFVEAVDVVPTCLAALDQPAQDHLVEGRSLLPLLRGGGRPPGPWRDAVFSELDYAFREARLMLGRKPNECRAIMVRDDRWKYVWWQDFRPMLFDLADDPQERRDLGGEPGNDGVKRAMEDRIAAWLKGRKTRVTVDDAYVAARTNTHRKHGIHFGVW